MLETKSNGFGNGAGSTSSPVELPSSEQIAAAMQGIDQLAGWLERSGLAEGAIAQWKYNCLASLYPVLGAIAESAKSMLGTTMPVPDPGMNVTEIASILSERLDKKIKPADVNKALIELGFQVRNDSERAWEVTEAGREYGQAFLATSRTNDWQGTQTKWFKAVIPLLLEHFEAQAAQDAELESQSAPAETSAPGETSAPAETSAPSLPQSSNSTAAPAPGEFWFIEERAKHLGFKTNATHRVHIEMHAVEGYKARYGKPPARQMYKKTQATAFPVEAIDILDAAINKIMLKA